MQRYRDQHPLGQPPRGAWNPVPKNREATNACCCWVGHPVLDKGPLLPPSIPASMGPEHGVPVGIPAALAVSPASTLHLQGAVDRWSWPWPREKEGSGGGSGEAVKNVNGAAWSMAPAVWHSPELARARGGSPRPRAPFVPGLGYVKGGGRGKNPWNLSIHRSPPAASRCENGGGRCGLWPGRFRNKNCSSACSGLTNRFLGFQPLRL